MSSISVQKNGLTYSTSYTHDTLGRIATSKQVTGNDPAYTFSYQYSLSDRVSQIQYPSGRIVNYLPDSAGRVQTVQNAGSGVKYAQLSYTAPGDVSTLTMGNTLVESLTWNDRLQPVQIQVGSQLTLGLYPCTGLVTACASGNNGNIRSQKIILPGLTATQNYTYDSVNRLLSAVESGGSSTWSESYAYDDGNNHQTANRYVNPNPAVRTGLPTLTSETPTGPAWFGTNNQIGNGWQTDSAGNVQTVGGTGSSFTWDAEDRQTSATVNGVTWNYLYDGLGQRVQKSGNGSTTTFVYDADGNLASEYQAAGELPAVCGTATCYVTVDHLGSTRMITDNAATPNVAARYDYLPFGTELQAGTGGRLASMGYTLLPDGFGLKYTGQVRDQETGHDWFHARMYSAAQGRFTGVDPGNAGADMGDSQSWNGYAYVSNNPMTFTDPTGMWLCASCAVDESGNPIAIGIAAAIDIGELLAGLFGLGGGGSKPPYANFPFPNPSQSAPPSGVGGNGFQDPMLGMPLSNPVQGNIGADVLATLIGMARNEFWHVTHPGAITRAGTVLKPIPINPTPFRLFGTYHCGPGGAGSKAGLVNGACAAHDSCYEDAKIDANGNTNARIEWKPGKSGPRRLVIKSSTTLYRGPRRPAPRFCNCGCCMAIIFISCVATRPPIPRALNYGDLGLYNHVRIPDSTGTLFLGARCGHTRPSTRIPGVRSDLGSLLPFVAFISAIPLGDHCLRLGSLTDDGRRPRAFFF